MALIVRKRRDGTTELEGGGPDAHTFAASFISRELGDAVEVVLTVAGVGYRLDGFVVDETDDGDRLNVSGWICSRLDGKGKSSSGKGRK